MKHSVKLLALALICIAGVAQAKLQPHHPLVKARIANMESFRSNFSVLGNMAKGKLDFNATQAATAAALLRENAPKIVTTFETEAHDPASEAKDAVWSDFEDFAAKAAQMVEAVNAIDTSSLAVLREGVTQIGLACKACHDDYKN